VNFLGDNTAIMLTMAVLTFFCISIRSIPLGIRYAGQEGGTREIRFHTCFL
jgi:hypothetical protein